MPSSSKVGMSGSGGWRLSIDTASARTLPLLFTANAVQVIAPSTCPASTEAVISPVPLYGM